MSRLRVHAVRFYRPAPLAIHCLAYCDQIEKLALSRSDNSVEIWDFKNGCLFQEKIIPPEPGLSVESLLWCQRRLFSVGLTGVIIEFDLLNLCSRSSIPTSFGACWCAAVNSLDTHLAIGTEEGYLCMFKVSDETVEFERSFDKQEGRIMCVAWHTSCDIVVSGSVDSIRVWDVQTGHAIQRMTVGRSSASVETIIWCIAVTQDYVIIIGDSRGHVSFWDAMQGVLIQSIRSHQAGILTLNLESCGTKVRVAGVDPQLIDFCRVKSGDLNQDQWVEANVLRVHTHDVRGLTKAGDFAISGGVDSYLVLTRYPPKVVLKYSPLPNHSCAQVCRSANCLLLQYNSRLELWRLGSTHDAAVEDNKQLPLSADHMLLVELKAKEGERVIASAISTDATWLAYSTTNSLRLFQINIENMDSNEPNVSLVRVRCLPKECRSARCLQFDNAANRLITLRPSGDLSVIKMDVTQPVLQHQFKPEGVSNGWHLLTISQDGSYAALGSHCGQVLVFNINDFKVCCRLPKRHHQATAIAFVPKEPPRLVVAYQDKIIRSFDINKRQYEDWSLNIDKREENSFTDSAFTFRSITFDTRDDNMVIMHNDTMLYQLNIQMLKTDYKNQSAIKPQQRYEHLVHFSNVMNDFMVAVEVSPLSLINQLPPQLKQKKYGT